MTSTNPILLPPSDNELRWAGVYGVRLTDPGYIYLVHHAGRYKIGRSRNPGIRLREAKTWNLDLIVIGAKPVWDHSSLEKTLHCGFADSWYSHEWFKPYDEHYERFLVDDFQEFSDHPLDRFENSINFNKWIASNGMAEFIIERNARRQPLRSFQRSVSSSARPKP